MAVFQDAHQIDLSSIASCTGFTWDGPDAMAEVS